MSKFCVVCEQRVNSMLAFSEKKPTFVGGLGHKNDNKDIPSLYINFRWEAENKTRELKMSFP